MKKLLLLSATFLLCQHTFAQVSPCNTTPPATSVTPNTSTICAGASTTLYLTVLPSGSGNAYQWQSSTTSAVGPFSNLPGASGNSLITPSQSVTTWYQVIITCTNGGAPTTASSGQVVVTTCTGIYKQHGTAGDLKIYPVPADHSLMIEMAQPSGSTFVKVYSIDGRQVVSGLQNFENGKLLMDVSAFAAGTYILEVSSQNEQTRKIFSIER